MDVPLEIDFHNLDPSESLAARIRERVEKLDRMYGRVVACRVGVEAPHRQHRKGNVYTIHLELNVPGDTLVVNHAPHHIRERYRRPNLHAIVNDAFDVAERRLQDFKTRQRGETKPHPAPLIGRITAMNPDLDHGFLMSAEGRELYFHRNSVTNHDFERLGPGDRVQYVETIGDTGPQAARVWVAPNDHAV